jgi:ribosomal protein L40E
MQTKEKSKMCPHCEGSIPIDAVECRYCGSSLQKKEEKKMAYQTEDSLASLYEPPYAPNRTSPNRYSLSRDDPYPKEEELDTEEEEDLFKKKEPISRLKKEKVTDEEEKSHIGSLLLLSIGGHLFTLAWLQFFFSDHGILALSWKSRYWPLYLFLSLPFIYHGWKKLKNS